MCNFDGSMAILGEISIQDTGSTPFVKTLCQEESGRRVVPHHSLRSIPLRQFSYQGFFPLEPNMATYWSAIMVVRGILRRPQSPILLVEDGRPERNAGPTCTVRGKLI